MNVTGMPAIVGKAQAELEVGLVDRLKPQLRRATDPHRRVLVQRFVPLENALRLDQRLQLRVPDEALREMLRDAVDISRAERDDEVARLQNRIHRRAETTERRLVFHLGMTVGAHHLGQDLRQLRPPSPLRSRRKFR